MSSSLPSSLLLESQSLLDPDDMEQYQLEEEPQEDEQQPPEAEKALKGSGLDRQNNPALGAASALLPHLRWLCACCAIPTASTPDSPLPASAAHNTPGDANSAITAVANMEQLVISDYAGHSVPALLRLLLKGEQSARAAPSTSPSSLSLTPSSASSAASAASSSSSGGPSLFVPGILSILRTLVASNRLDPVRGSLIQLLLQVAQKHAGSLRPHLSSLIHLCLFLVRAEKLGRNREKAMELLAFLLMFVHATSLDISHQADYTPPRDIVEQLLRQIHVSKSKLSQSMRGQLLSTLGLLSELFEEEFRRQPGWVHELADLYGRALVEEAESNKDPNRKVIEGCLIGLKHFLMHFSECYRTRHPQKVLRLENIYRAVRTAINMQDATNNRYDILRAGLACFSRHAALFREFFTPSDNPAVVAAVKSEGASSSETDSLLSVLVQATKHQNITVATRANYALEAFLHQLAAWLVEGNERTASPKDMPDDFPLSPSAASSSSSSSLPSSKRRLFNLLISVFVKKLDTTKGVSEVSMAVRAVGQLARVIVIFMNERELQKLLLSLLDKCEKLFRAHTLDEVDRALTHLPDFLSAFAFILKELSSCDSTVLDYLVSMLRRFFLAYPTLTSSQRSKNLLALTRVFVVLYDKGIVLQQLLEKTIFPALVLTSSKLPALSDSQYYSLGRPQVAERHAYVEYCYLFHNLLGVSIRQDEKGDKTLLGWNHGLDYGDPTLMVWGMRKVLFEQIMKEALRMINTLDLNLQKVAEEGERKGEGQQQQTAAAASSSTPSISSSLSTHGDPSSSFTPTNPKDFELFYNLVEFLQRFFYPPYGGSSNQPQKVVFNHYVSSKGKLSELVLPSGVSSSNVAASSFLPKWALQWLSLYVPDLVTLSTKQPLVSGYYKLLSLLGKIMEQFGYLEGIDLEGDGHDEDTKEEKQEETIRVKQEGEVRMEDVEEKKEEERKIKKKSLPLDTVANRRYVYRLLSSFLSSVLVRIGQYSDELLFSSLQLVLNAPLQFVHLDRWVPALVKSIQIGLNYRPAAWLSIDVLMRWQEAQGRHIRVNSEELTKYMPDILPHFNDYLRLNKHDSATTALAAEGDRKAVSSSKSKGARSSGLVDSGELELVSRILQFLGRVGGHNRYLLGREAGGEVVDASAAAGSSSSSISVTVAPAWQPTRSIRYALPLSAQKFDVHLDQLVPHLSHLAEFSTERQVQVAACEALHSLVIYMIATTARDPNRSATAEGGKAVVEESAFLPLYTHLFPILLRLATSVEVVTAQLFHPLLFQIIHWFTNTNTTMYKDTRALLDAVTEAVGNDSNGALREYAAEAMAEFLKWSIKHTAQPATTTSTGRRSRGAAQEEKESAAAVSSATLASGLNIKALLRRLYSLLLHPSPYKRLGGALTFNKLYRIFRESDSLISQHTLELIDHMLHSLRLAEHDPEALSTKEEVRTALEALDRIVVDKDARKYNLLIKEVEHRAGGAHCRSLPLFITNLLENAGFIEDDYRRESLRLFQAFAEVLPAKAQGADKGKSFFKYYISELHSLEHFVAIVERGEGAVEEQNGAATPSLVSASSSTVDAIRNEMLPPPWIVDSALGEDTTATPDTQRWLSLQTWLTRLSSSLDVYWWLLKEKLLSDSSEDACRQLFGEMSSSHLKDSLKQFLLLLTHTPDGSAPPVDAWVERYAQDSSDNMAAATLLKETYAHLKCTVLIRLVRIMQMLLADTAEQGGEPGTDALSAALLGKAFYSLLFQCLLMPESMGFQTSNMKRIRQLQSSIGQLCGSLNKLNNKGSVIDVLSNVLQQPSVSPSSFQLSSLLTCVGFSSLVIDGYRHLWSSGLLSLTLGASTCTDFTHALLDQAFRLYTDLAGHEQERRVTLTPLGRNVAFQMLQLAFHMGVSPDRLFACLTDQSSVQLPPEKEKRAAAASVPAVKEEPMDIDTATARVDSSPALTAPLISDSRKGGVFHTQFRSLIDSYLAAKFDTYAMHMLNLAFNDREVFGVLLNVADHIIQRRQRKTAVQGAFQEVSGPAAGEGGASSAAASASSSSSGFTGVLGQVHAQANSYVSRILDGFADACAVFVANRPTLTSASSTASTSSSAPLQRKRTARHRSNAASGDTSKLLRLPEDNELALLLLQLLERLLILDAPRTLSSESNPSFQPMLDLYIQCIGKEASIPLKKKALSLLPALLFAPTTSPVSSSTSLPTTAPSLLHPPPGMEPLFAALKQMVIQPPFPPRSTDLLVGSPDYVDYTSLLDLLLNALVLSKSFALLQLLLPLLREGPSHSYKHPIHQSLSNYLTSLVDTSIGERAGQVDSVLDAAVDMFLDADLDHNPDNNVRYWLANYIIIPLLRLGATATCRKFFLAHTKRLFAIISALPDGPKLTLDLDDQRVQLLELECCYNMLSLMFKRLPKDDPALKEVPHKDIIKSAHMHVKFAANPHPDKMSYMAFCSAAYNALSAALMATQNDPKFLNVLCFNENKAKGEDLWGHLFDVRAIGMVRFEIETNFPTVDAQLADFHLLSRPTNVASAPGTVGVGGEGEGGGENSRYLSSQYLSDSSVSQDAMGLFESQVSGPMLLWQQVDQGDGDVSNTESQDEEMLDEIVPLADSSSSSAGENGGVVELVDLDPILSLPAVPILLNLLQYMEDRFGAKHRLEQEEADYPRMPEWLQQLFNKFNSSQTPVVIKWAIAKLIVLKPHVFKPYAGMWFLPIVQLLTLPPEKSGGVGMHYFLRDLCSVFLRWRFVPGPDEPDRQHASGLISHLMRVAVDHGSASEGKRSRLRANLLTIKLLVDLWQHRLTIDRQVIFQHLTRDLGKSRLGSDAHTARQVGLQELGIILEKGFPAYDAIEDRSLKEDDMLRALIDTLLCGKKTLYEPAAEVLGIWIRKQATDPLHKEPDHQRMHQFCLQAVRQALKKLYFQREYAMFLNILLKLSLYIGRLDFLNDELLTFLFQIPQLQAEYLHKFLQLLCWSSTTTGRGMYEQLTSTMRRVFLMVDARAHELMLMILFRLAAELTLDELRALLPDLQVLFPTHTSESCRMLFYKLLIWIYDHHPDFQPKKKAFLADSQDKATRIKQQAEQETSSAPSTTEMKDDALVHLVIVCLLRGLADPVASIRNHLFDFWDDPSRLSRDISERLLMLLTSLFHRETVDLWLSYATRLLLYPMRTSSDWDRPFSDQPLAAVKFTPLNINASGYTRTQAMVPLFSAGTQQSAPFTMGSGGGSSSGTSVSGGQQEDYPMEDANSEMGGMGFVLNSQAMGGNFHATPSLMSMSTQELMEYNLSQASQSEHLYYRATPGASQAMGSYQAFTASPHHRAIRKRLKVSIKSAHRVQIGSDSVALRFAGSQAGARSSANRWRQQADLRNRYQRVWEARLAEESAQSVTMYRQYRKGELPDIQVCHRELLQPLEGLHTEPVMARQLFVLLFQAIYTQTYRSPDELKRYHSEVREAVRTLIHRLTPHAASTAAPLILALQTAILEVGRVDASFTAGWSGKDIRQLGELSFHSKMYHSGILLLEHIIATKSEVSKARSSKRAREQAEQTNQRHLQAYFQLARLYRELGENEIMLHLYQSFATQFYTRDALTHMLRGDWSHAMGEYDAALSRHDEVQEGLAAWEGNAPSEDEIELWNSERLECMRQLTDWSALRENVLVEVDGAQHLTRLWEPQYVSREYLKHYLTSGIKVAEEHFLHISNAAAASAGVDAASASAEAAGADPRHELLQFVEHAFSHRDQSDILQNFHAADLVLLYALNGQMDRASTFLRHTYARFLKAWTELPDVAVGPRLSMLQRLQKLTEVAEFLQVESKMAALPSSSPTAASSNKTSSLAPASKLLSLTSDLHHQLSVWRGRLPNSSDSVESWDDIVLNRSAFLVHLKQALEGRIEGMSEGVKKMAEHVLPELRGVLSTAVVEMHRKAASVMLKQGNASVADKYINSSRQLLQAHGILAATVTGPREEDASKQAQFGFLHAYSSIKVKLHHLLSMAPAPGGVSANSTDMEDADEEKQEEDEQIKRQRAQTVKSLQQLLTHMWNASIKLDKAGLSSQPQNAYRIATMKARLQQHMSEYLLADPSLAKYADHKGAEEQYGAAGDELDSLALHFQEKMTDPSLNGAAKAEERAQLHQQASKAFMAVVKFCDYRLSQAEEHADTCVSCKARSPCADPLRLPADLERHLIESLVQNCMAAMKLGAKAACGFFPRALDLIARTDAHSPARHKFVSDTEQIPSWMFIQWIPQLLSVISLPQGALAVPILVRIAKEYPQAVYYPFQLTKESLTMQMQGATTAAASRQQRKYIQAIGVHLNNRLIADFVDSLDYLHVPEMKLTDFMRKMQRLMLDKDNAGARELWKHFRNKHFSTNCSHVAKCKGSVYQQFSAAYKEQLDRYFGADGSLILKMVYKGPEQNSFHLAQAAVAAIAKKHPGVGREPGGKHELSRYTTWLLHFERWQAQSGESIELPGQYTGLQRPHPELHVRIVNFAPTVLVMSSLRKPKRLTIHGSDERSHNYLVKGGEDLRLDQRIEQLFVSMNEILSTHPASSRRGLNLRTYQVVPLTATLGMLEWVDNTRPLKGMLLEQVKGGEQMAMDMARKYGQHMFGTLPANSPLKSKAVNDAHIYYNYLRNVDRKRVVDFFSSLQTTLPADLISRSLSSLCLSPDSFLQCRSNFARSFCSLTLCAYILGLGDRHLENFLVDTANGQLVGIDFGAAFGQGVLLSVPELMPFRFTRQFQHMLDPLHTEPILKQDMTYVMQALREKKGKLLTIMNVFIREPQMEWIQSAKSAKQNIGLEGESDRPAQSPDWYPRRKVLVAKMKLEGHNPAKILSVELKENRNVFADSKLYEKCVVHLRGEDDGVRSQLDLRCGPEQQVDMLVDMAKDPNILGRTWVGWGPFI